MANRFDAETHTYYMDDIAVPSVTQVLSEVLPVEYHGSSDWHMERGKAVHACAAMYATGKTFNYDTQIEGYVHAIRSWFDIRRPVVKCVELQRYSETYRFGMTLDMICEIDNHNTIVDWKSSASKRDYIQLGGYHIGTKKEYPCTRGLVVELHENGTFQEGITSRLKVESNEFLACLSVYNIRKRLGLLQKGKTS